MSDDPSQQQAPVAAPPTATIPPPVSADVVDDASAAVEIVVTSESQAAAVAVAAESGPSIAGKPSGIKPPAASRIGRPCTGHGHAPKAGPPPPPVAEQQDTSSTMRRQPDEYSRSSHLSDVHEESEAELLSERRTMDRSTKSRSPSEASGSGGGRSLKGGSGDRKISSGSLSSEHYLEATGKRRSSDQSVVLTTDTDSFIIGQRIWVGGQRPGHIAYIGETHFAPGDWAGIVLDEPSGKNDGCVSGKRYFQCEPKRGIFSRLTRLTREPLVAGTGGASTPTTPDYMSSMNMSSLSSMASPAPRSGAVSPSQSVRSYATGVGRTPGKGNLAVGDRIIVSSGLGSRPGILKYVGDTHFAVGTWCGVQLDEPSGKNDGSVDGQSYFECLPNYGIFVPIAKVSLSPSSRKTRMSRAGSKESLTSVGTIGSMASTVTSRMRLSGVQQDILREKQNHIEQLLLERELEKQEAENQIIAYQKDINQLKETIVTLEKRFLAEAKRSEELQSNIEEATFCGDELNAQTQDYRERIAKLESQLACLQTTTSTTATASAANHHTEMRALADDVAIKSAALVSAEAELRQRSEELAALGERYKDAESEWSIASGSLAVSEQCLRDELRFVQAENDQLKTELRTKDEATEKEYLAMRHIEHELKEELAAAQAQLAARDATLAENAGALQQLVAQREAQLVAAEAASVGAAEVHQLQLQKVQAELAKAKELGTEAGSGAERQAAENQELSARLQQLLEEIAGHKQTICESAAQLVRVQAEVAAAEVAAAAKAAKWQENTEALVRQREEAEQLRATCAEWSMKFENLQRSNSELSDVVLAEKEARIEELTAKTREDGEELAKLRESAVSAETEIAGLKTEADNRESQREKLQAELGELQSQLEAARAELSANNQKAADLREGLDRESAAKNAGETLCANLQQEIKDLRSQLETSQAKAEQLLLELSTKSSQLTTTASEAEDRAQEGANLRLNIAQLQQDIDRLTADLGKEHAKHEELITQLQADRNEKAATDAVLATLQVDHADVQRQLQIAADRVAQLQQEKAGLLQQMDSLQSSSSDTNSEVHRLQSELQQQQATHDERQEKAQAAQLALERRVHELTQNLAARTTQWERVREEMDSLTAQKIERENELNLELSRQKEAAEAARVELQTECRSLRSKFDEDRLQLTSDAKEQLHQSESVQLELRTNLGELNDRIRQLSTELTGSQQSSAKLEASLATAAAELSATEARHEQEAAQQLAAAKILRESLEDAQQSSGLQVAQLSASLQESRLQAATAETLVAKLQADLAEAAFGGQQQSTQVQQLSEDLAAIRSSTSAQIELLTAQLAESSARNAQLDEQFKTTEDDQVDLVNKNLEMVEEIQLLRQQLSESSEQGSGAAKLAESRELQLSQLRAEWESLQASNSSTESALAEQQSRAQQLHETSADLGAKLEKVSRQLAELQTESQERIAHAEAQRVASEAASSQQKEQIAALQAQISQLLSSADVAADLKVELQRSTEQSHQLEATISQLQAQLHAQAELEATQLASVAALQNDLANSATNSASQQQQHLAELSRLQDKCERLELGARDAGQLATAQQQSLAQQLAERSNQLQQQELAFAKRLESDYVERSQFECSRDMLAALTAESHSEVAGLQEQLAKAQALLVVASEAQRREKDVAYERQTLQRREEQLQLENKRLAERLTQAEVVAKSSAPLAASAHDSKDASADSAGAQIEFLNSIIADMQRKNENLLLRISALEESPQEFIKNSLYEVPMRREPAPRMFCDICDIFDAHETEDCPLQSSGTPSPPLQANGKSGGGGAAEAEASGKEAGQKERKLPAPRKYCSSCGVFGHADEECDADETY